MTVISSPLRRALQTAAPIAARWGTEIKTEPAIGEIEPPAGADQEGAAKWLTQLAKRRWTELAPEHQSWRQRVLEFASSLSEPTLFVTHMVAINVLMGFAERTQHTIVFWPANCSVSMIDTGEAWRVVRRGRQRPVEKRHFGWVVEAESDS